MNCNICGAHEATIHLTEIVNSQMMEIHLCETCAQEKGTDFKTHFNFNELFADLVSSAQPEPAPERRVTLKCAECGLTYEEFTKKGRLGCSACYDSFAKALLPLIKRIQKSTHHIGKKPSKITGRVRVVHDLRSLQERLRKSVESESFEDAAHLRDEIKQLEDKIKKGKKRPS